MKDHFTLDIKNNNEMRRPKSREKKNQHTTMEFCDIKPKRKETIQQQQQQWEKKEFYNMKNKMNKFHKPKQFHSN